MSGCRLFASDLVVDEAYRRSGDVISGGFACLFTGGETLTDSRHNLVELNKAKQEAILGQRGSRAEGAQLENEMRTVARGTTTGPGQTQGAEAGETLGGRVTGCFRSSCQLGQSPGHTGTNKGK